MEDGALKYSVCVMIPKKDKATVAAIQEATAEAVKLGLAEKWGGKKTGAKIAELRDGDELDDDGERLKGDEFKGMYYINVSGKNKPIILDRDRNEVLDKTEVYSGCWANVAINFYAYAAKTATGTVKGVGAGLEAIRKVKDDDSLAGGTTVAAAKAMFDDVEDDEEI